ncbi:uncharacterized protein LOC144476530 [Augochlora pura]
MYVTETGGHKVAPMPSAKAKMLDYKPMNDPSDRGGGGGGGGGGGSHLAATVKNTFRRLLRRTKSHRDPPSTIPATIPGTGTPRSINGTPANNAVTVRNKPNNANDPIARRSQPPLPPSNSQHPARTSYSKRHTRPRVSLQVSEIVAPAFED